MGTKCCRAMRKCFGCVWRCCAVQISCDYILPTASLMMPSIPGFAALRAPHPSSPARRGGVKQIEAQRPAAFRAFSVQGLTGAGLPTALYEKSPAQSAELQFVCGERGIRNSNPTPSTIVQMTTFYSYFLHLELLNSVCFWDIFGIFSLIFILLISQKHLHLQR